MRRRLSVAIIWCACVVALTAPLLAAGPRAIVFSGGPLKERAYLADWAENIRFMEALEPTTLQDADVQGRAFIEFATFSSAQWDKATVGNRKITEVRPDEGTPGGRFYPATADRAPLFVSNFTWTRVWIVRPPGLEILKRHGIPTQAQMGAPGGVAGIWTVTIVNREPVQLELKIDGAKLTGTFGPTPVVGELKDRQFTFAEAGSWAALQAGTLGSTDAPEMYATVATARLADNGTLTGWSDVYIRGYGPHAIKRMSWTAVRTTPK